MKKLNASSVGGLSHKTHCNYLRKTTAYFLINFIYLLIFRISCLPTDQMQTALEIYQYSADLDSTGFQSEKIPPPLKDTFQS